MTRLLLFDIDNTLLYTGGAGSHAMTLALQEMFGVTDGFAKVEFSGRTDLYILSEGLSQHGIIDGLDANLGDFLQRYYAHLRHTLREREGHLMHGFPQLLEALSQREGVRVGLATGNFSEAWLYVTAPIVGAIVAAIVHTGLARLALEGTAAAARMPAE